MSNHWKRDFRYEAIRASISRASQFPDSDPFDLPFSFCLPVAEKPIVAWITPGRIVIVFLVLGMAGILGGAITVSIFDENHKHVNFWLAVGCSFSLTGFICLLTPILLQDFIISWGVGDRGKMLLQNSNRADLLCCELGDSVNPSITIDGDDHVIVHLDRANNRLLIEGISATYQILAKDVVLMLPFEFGSYLGADIVYSVDEETTLRIGIAKASQIKEFRAQATIFYFLDRWVRNKVYDDIFQTLMWNRYLEIDA